MTAFSDYLENNLGDHVLGIASYTSPSNIYLALFTDDPTDADTGTEVSGGGYSRLDVTGKFNAFSGGSSQNNADLAFPTATVDWGTVTHAAIYDASTGGNLLLHASVSTSKTINSGDTAEFKSGNITVTLD